MATTHNRSALLSAVLMAAAMIAAPAVADDLTSVERGSGQAIRMASQIAIFGAGDTALLERLRSEVMTSIRYEQDGLPVTIPASIPDASATGVGDCKGMSVAMRNKLLAEGFAPDSLLLAVGRTEKGVGHMVLLIRGKYHGQPQTRVFDVRAREIVSLEALLAAGYTFDGIQSSGDADAIFVRWNGERYF